MKYLKKRGKWYHYQRRVPIRVLQVYELLKVKVKRSVEEPLYTDSEILAEERSISVNKRYESFWNDIIAKGITMAESDFQKVVQTAKLMGFTYRSQEELVDAPLPKVLNRLQVLSEAEGTEQQVKALLGGAKAPTMLLSQALERFWDISDHEIMDKSPQQIRKWKNPIIKAINDFIELRGDKELTEYTRNDMTEFRKWWIGLINNEGRKANTYNKAARNVKKVMLTVSEHERVDVKIDWIFKNYSLDEDDTSTTPPFETQHVKENILNPKYHETLNLEARCILYAMADTGARPSELVGLRPQDIDLEADVPHIRIHPYKGHKLKNKYSKREIPLVGCALWAFKQMPTGFPRYRDSKSGRENLSAVLNKHLNKMNLLPTEEHTVYSLRHSFDDRMTDAGVITRIAKELFGHKIPGTVYGDGGTLERKQEWLLKLCFEEPKTLN